MSYKSVPEDLALTDYTDVLKRRWWLIVLVAIIGALGSLGYYKVAHKTYTATASVFVTGNSGNANQVSNGRTSGTVNLDTEAQVVQSVVVAQAAAKLMHSPTSLPQILSRVKVTVPANSQVLSISCQSGKPATAATCAESFAEAYLNYSSATATASTNSQLKAIQSKISALESTSSKLIIEIANLPSNSSQRAAGQEQLNSDNSQLSSLNNQVAQLTAALADPSAGSIISNAAPPQTATSPRLLLVGPSGLLVGLLLGLVLAFIVNRRDRRIRGPRDVDQLDVPVLMSLPLKRSALELAIAAPRSVIGREFSELAYGVARSLGSGNHMVIVTGASGGEGAALVAVNLAAALSRSQPDAVLVCANLEGSAIPGMVGLSSQPGLTEVLANEVQSADAIQYPAAAPRLQVITPGAAASPDADDLQQDAVDRLLTGLARKARWVIVEAPPVHSGPDIYALAHTADAVILVAELPKVRRDRLAESVQQLDKMGTAVLGVVLLPSPKAPAKAAAPAVNTGNSVKRGRPSAATPDAGLNHANGENAEYGRQATGPVSSERNDDEATLIFRWHEQGETPSSPRELNR